MPSEAALPLTSPVVVVFRPKGQRTRVLDKTDVVRGVIADERRRDMTFFSGAAQQLGSTLRAADPDLCGIDVNHHDTPIVCLRVSAQERAQLARHPDVVLVEDDFDFVYSALPPGAALRVQGQPTLERETIPAGVAQVGAPQAWGNSQGKGMRVAILDTGIDDSHADLAANVLGGVGLVAGTPSERDDEGHGTFCAGIIGAGVTGAGIVGVAPQASLYAVKVSDQQAQPTLKSVIAGLDWCIANHMHIISMSFGFPMPSLALHLMCKRAWESGALLVASAGNDGRSDAIHYPAALDSVVGVGAIDEANVRYRQSNAGPGLDLCAPGVNVLSTGLRGAYQTMSGTSAAGPHVAGAAALAWGSHRFASNREIFHLLASTARRLGSHAGSGVDPAHGHGRVNALGASGALVRPLPPLMAISGCSVQAATDASGQRRAMRSDELSCR